MNSRFSNLKNSYKIGILILLFFLLTLHCLFPIILVGSPVILIPDILNYFVPNNFIAGKIMGGNFDSAKLFMNEELPWHFIYGIFYPINYIYGFLEIDKAYIFIDLLTRFIGFLSCLYFLKQFRAEYLLKILISCLFASQLATTAWGLGVATFPYIFSISLRKKDIKTKHLLLIILTALNTDLYLHGIYIILIIVSSIFFLKNKILEINIKNLLKILITYSLILIISNSNFFYNFFYFSPFQLSERLELISIEENIIQFFKGIFLPESVNGYFFSNVILSFLILISIFFTLVGKTKNNITILKLLIFFQTIIFFINLLLHFKVFSGAIFNRLGYFLIFFQILLIFNFFSNLQTLRKFFFFLLFLSIIYNQISPSLFTVVKAKSNYGNFTKIEKETIKKNYQEFKILRFIKNYNNFSQSVYEKGQISNVRSYHASSFKSYYRIKDFETIKKYVGNNKTFSIGFDPFISVVNDIKVIGGYYRYYPIAYKNKFFKIVENQIKYLESKKNPRHIQQIENFKKNGQVLRSFYNEGDEFKINLNKLKELNVKFIVSKYFIENTNLEIVCEGCSNKVDLNLYKIK